VIAVGSVEGGPGNSQSPTRRTLQRSVISVHAGRLQSCLKRHLCKDHSALRTAR
jgi:hypothetical protein